MPSISDLMVHRLLRVGLVGWVFFGTKATVRAISPNTRKLIPNIESTYQQHKKTKYKSNSINIIIKKYE